MIRQPRRTIYVIHPFKGAGRPGEREVNRQRIGAVCRAVIRLGHVPISPIHALSFLHDEDPEDRTAALRLCRPYIEMADEIWAFVIARRAFDPVANRMHETWVESAGCRQDHDHAVQAGKPITYHLYEQPSLFAEHSRGVYKPG